jgi:hypothetical protein
VYETGPAILERTSTMNMDSLIISFLDLRAARRAAIDSTERWFDREFPTGQRGTHYWRMLDDCDRYAEVMEGFTLDAALLHLGPEEAETIAAKLVDSASRS